MKSSEASSSGLGKSVTNPMQLSKILRSESVSVPGVSKAKLLLPGDVGLGKIEIDEMTHKKPKENASIVDIIGIESAKQRLNILSEQAKDHLKIFGKKAEILKDLVEFLINRSS